MFDPPLPYGYVRLKLKSPHWTHSCPVDLQPNNWNGEENTLDKVIVDTIRAEFFLRPEAVYARIGEYFVRQGDWVQGSIQFFTAAQFSVVSVFYDINKARDDIRVKQRIVP